MGQSVLVFVSHSSEDKEDYIENIVNDLEECYINVWIDKKRILPGDNLRKSIFRDGLDKADVVLIFFTEQSIKSRWVDREIKHVLREEQEKGNDFDLKKIISIYDSQKTYNELSDKYPELTDDLLHLMPRDYNKIQFGQLISAIWSKHLSLQGGDIETQKQLLAKDRELFQKDKEIQELKTNLEKAQANDKNNSEEAQFEVYLKSGKLHDFINVKNTILKGRVKKDKIPNLDIAIAFGLISVIDEVYCFCELTQKGKDFFQWYILNHTSGEQQ
jgi:hypothetical protein